MPATPKKETPPKDENTLISPKQSELPEVPKLGSQTHHQLSQTQKDDSLLHAKRFLSLTVIGLLAVGVGVYLGTKYFDKDDSNDQIFLARESGLVTRTSGEVMISPDNGISWAELTDNQTVHPGLQVDTTNGGSASVSLGTNSSINVAPGSVVSLLSLNNIKVGIEILNGGVETKIADTETWTFEMMYSGESYTTNGNTSVRITNQQLLVEVESGTATYGSQNYNPGESFELIAN